MAAVHGWCERHWEHVDRSGDPGPVGLIQRERIVLIDGVEHRPCSTCGDVKPCANFYRYKSGYYDSDSKPCARAKALAYRKVNVEKARTNSRRYYHNNPEKQNARTTMRRDIERTGAESGPQIIPSALAEAFGWICQLCFEPIDPTIKHRQWGSNPMGLVVDHIVPLGRGGQHTVENVQPAHAVCNQRKQDKLNAIIPPASEYVPIWRTGVGGEVTLEQIESEIQDTLVRGSLTRHQIRGLFSRRRVPSDLINRALMGLAIAGRVHVEKRPAVRGRPPEVWQIAGAGSV